MNWHPPKPAVPSNGRSADFYLLDQLLAVRQQTIEECAALIEVEAWRLKKVAVDTGSGLTNMRAIQASNDVDAIRKLGAET